MLVGSKKHFGEFCYNTTFHMSIDMSHFKEIYGYDASTFIDHIFVIIELQRLRIALKKVKKF